MKNLNEALFGVFHMPTRTQHQYNEAEILKLATLMDLHTLRSQQVFPRDCFEFDCVEAAIIRGKKDGVECVATYWPDKTLSFARVERIDDEGKPTVEKSELISSYALGCELVFRVGALNNAQ